MGTIGVDSFAAYQNFLQAEPDEFTHLFDTVLINVTSFFRDPAAWEMLAAEVRPARLASRSPEQPVRVWCAGCASGQEPYSVAIILAELLGAEGLRERVKIYATDMDEHALRQARAAVYSAREVASVPPALLDKYFQRVGERFVVSRELRRAVIFGRHNLLRDAPISRVDLLTCRNTLMYLNADVQAKILARLHFALRDEGVLMLGKAEMIWTHAHLFLPVDLKRRLFCKVGRDVPGTRLHLPVPGEEKTHMTLENLPPVLYEVNFDSGALAQIVVAASGVLTMANEKARSLFRLHARDVGRPLQELEISYRPAELRALIEWAEQEKHPHTVRGVQWLSKKEETLLLDVAVLPLLDAEGAFLGTSVTFSDVTRIKQLQDELRESSRELETAYEELQSTNEELETTNEELQSTVEELETTNEELHSTNEELETMNEEMYSTNDELQAINAELRLRGAEFNRANAFLESVLTSIRAGVVVLDREMRVQVWTDRAQEFWGLRAEEVVGSPFLNLNMGLPAEPLLAPIPECLNGAKDTPHVTVQARNRRGREFPCQIVFSALRGADAGVDGVILLMEDEADT